MASSICPCRFTSDQDSVAFLRDLSQEVSQRLKKASARGRTITLKLKRRSEVRSLCLQFRATPLCHGTMHEIPAPKEAQALKRALFCLCFLQGAGEPLKFLGHGVCDNLSKSVTLARATDAANDLARESCALLAALRVPFDQIRGIGIAVRRKDGRWKTTCRHQT